MPPKSGSPFLMILYMAHIQNGSAMMAVALARKGVELLVKYHFRVSLLMWMDMTAMAIFITTRRSRAVQPGGRFNTMVISLLIVQ